MPFDKILIFLAVIIAGITQIVAYRHYVDNNGIIFMATVLYGVQLTLGVKYIIDGKFSFHSFLILLIMLGIVGEYLGFNHWHGAALLKCTWAMAYIIVGILLIRKAWNHYKALGFIDSLTLYITALFLLFQASSFVLEVIPVQWILGFQKTSYAILLLSNTINYAIVALILTMLFKNNYRLLMLPGEIRILTFITLISTLPIVENFFLEFLSSFQ